MEKRKAQSLREVISTNKQFFQALHKDAQEIVAHEKEKIRKLRLPLPVAYADFKNLICEFGTMCMHNRNQAKDFVIDKNNEPDAAYIKENIAKELSKQPDAELYITQGFIEF